MTERSDAVNRDSGSPLLESFEIDGFRGLGSISFEQLGRMNLLVGSNNAGKTSILEALAIYSRPLDMMEWASVARAREGRSPTFMADFSSTIDSIRWIFPHKPGAGHGEDEHLPIHLRGRGRTKETNLDATCTPIRGIPPESQSRSAFSRRPTDELPIEDEGWLIRVGLSSDDSFFSEQLEFPLWSSLGLRYAPRHPKAQVRMEYLPPYSHRSQPNNLRRLTKSMMEEIHSSVDDLVRDLDPLILGTEIITSPDGRRPILAVRHQLGGLMPINVLGDGIRRAFALALAVPQARDGLLLVDEIEAALHISALDRIYPWLVNACRAFNVQLFASTHSIEVIDSIAKIDLSGPKELTAYHLTGDSHIPPKRYTGGMLKRLVHQQGLDVR